MAVAVHFLWLSNSAQDAFKCLSVKPHHMCLYTFLKKSSFNLIGFTIKQTQKMLPVFLELQEMMHFE